VTLSIAVELTALQSCFLWRL